MLALMVVEEIGVGVGGRGGGSSGGNNSGGGDEKKISKRCLPNLEAIFFFVFQKKMSKRHYYVFCLPKNSIFLKCLSSCRHKRPKRLFGKKTNTTLMII